ncbi:MAG: hypothetical protein IKW00_06900 [Clostridia bacterium]|nr:hypothetical protein [Clostridia bacterium]
MVYKSFKIRLAVLFSVLLITLCSAAFADTPWEKVSDDVGDNAYISDFLLERIIDGTGPFDADSTPGNDSSDNNKIVRTFDTLYYAFKVNMSTRDQSSQYKKAFLCFAAEIPFNSKQVKFATDGLPVGSVFEIKETGGSTPSQTLYVRMELGNNSSYVIPGTQTFSLPLSVVNLPDGTVIQPKFYAWLQGNDVYSNSSSPADITDVDLSGKICEAHKDFASNRELKTLLADEVTVSAKLKMNVSFKSVYSDYTSTLDFNSGNNPALYPDLPAANYGKGDIAASVMSFGILVNIENDIPHKKLRGLLYPEGPITFDLEFTSTYIPDDSEALDVTFPTSEYDYAPLLYSYGGNFSDSLNADGRSIPVTLNLSANKLPENATDSDRQYAVLNGGNWKAVQAGNKISITITDYEIDGIFPKKASSSSGVVMSEDHSGCISVGEIHIALPHNDQLANSTAETPYIAGRFGVGNYKFAIKDVNLMASAPSKSSESRYDTLAESKDSNTNQTRRDDDAKDQPCYLSNPGTQTPIIYYSKYDNNTSNSGALTEGCFRNGYDWILGGSKFGIISGYVDTKDNGNPNNKLIGYDDFLKIDGSVISFVDEIDDPEGALANANAFDWSGIPVKNMIRDENDPIVSDGTVDFRISWIRSEAYYGDYRILYAVKADGSNWASETEMCSAKPEDANLLWFTDLREAEAKGVVVGLLFQYRGNDHELNTVIYPRYKVAARISETAQVNDTYMITHFARTWTRMSLGSERIQEIESSANPGQAYASAVPFYTVRNGKLAIDSTDSSTAAFMEKKNCVTWINTAYQRMQYNEDGTTIGGLGSNLYGDTVYIPSYAPAVHIQPLNGATEKKNTFNAATGNIADFQFSPSLRLPEIYESSDTQATATVTLKVQLPKGLTYISNSSYWGGTYVPASVKGLQGTIQNPQAHLTENTLDKSVAYHNKWIFNGKKEDRQLYISMKCAEYDDGTSILTYRFTGVPLSECTSGFCNALLDSLYFSTVIEDNDAATNWTLDEMAIIFADGVTIEFSETNQNISYASLNVMKLKAEGLAISADNLYNEQDGVLGWTATYQNTTNTNNENALFFVRIGENGYSGTYTFSDWSLDLNQLRNNGENLRLWYTTASMEGKSAEDFSAASLTDAGFTEFTALSVDSGTNRLTADLSACGQITGWILTGPLNSQSTFSVHQGIKPSGNEPGNVYYAYDSFKAGSTSPLTSQDKVYVIGRELNGLVWYDRNYNGIRDAGESLIPGVTVELYSGETKVVKDVTGADIPETLTDNNGEYSFRKLPEGSYTVRFSNLPADYSGITHYLVADADTALNSDAKTENGITQISPAVSMSSANEIGRNYTQQYNNLDLGLIKLGEIEIGKTVSGDIPSSEIDRAFEFTLALTFDGSPYTQAITEGTTQIVPDANGRITFTLKHGESIVFSDILSGTAYTVSETSVPNYTPAFTNASGVISDAKTLVSCVNSYLPDAASYAPTVTKALAGQTPPSAASFTFTLTPAGENADGFTMPAVVQTTVQGTGTASFDAITFSKAGTYTFAIAENATAAYGYYNDAEGAWTLTVTVTDVNGTLTAVPSYTRGNASSTTAAFTNTYTPDPIRYSIEVSKRIEGVVHQAETYTFEMIGPDNAQEQLTMPLSVTAGVEGEGTAAFDPITFLAAGEYSFTVREVVGSTGNCVYDGSSITVTITVTDINGKLSVTEVVYKKNGAACQPEFVNTYNTGNLSITKTVRENDGDLNKAWHFVVTFAHADGSAFALPLPYDGSVTGTITSGGTITLTHGQTVTIRNIPAGLTYTVTETEANTGRYTTVSGGAAGTIANGQTSAASFTNTFKPYPVDYPISVTKIIEGVPAEEETYTFLLGAESGMTDRFTMPDSTEATVTGAGSVTFDPITFLAAGKYTFTVREIAGDTESCTYDDSVLTITVTVSNINGRLTLTEIVYEKNGEECPPDFVNAYQNGNLSIIKTVEANDGDLNKEWHFVVTFTYADGSEFTLPLRYDGSVRGTITSGGTITLTHDQFVTIHNIPAGLTYAVTETEANTGRYTTASIGETGTITNGQTASVSFTNTFTPYPVDYPISVSKRIEGSPAEEETYTFLLSGESGTTGRFTMPDSAEATVTGAGTATFDPITFLAVGEYTFTIREVAGSAANCTYDDSELTVTVTVANVNGRLMVTKTLCEKNGEECVPEFVNAYQAGSLTIAKTVEGNAGETDRAWHFKITLTDYSGATYNTSLRYDGAATGTIASGGIITLRHGESVTIHSIPAGITYTVTETDANTDGYTTSSVGAAGIIVNGKTANAHFTNTCIKADIPQTGDGTAYGLLSLLLAASFVTFVILVRRKQHNA